MDKLKEIKASIEKINKQYRESKGYAAVDCSSPSVAETQDVMYQMINSVYRYIDSVQSNFYRWQEAHSENTTHLPKLTPSQLEKLLKAAGAAGDFEVMKKMAWASTNNRGQKEFLIDLNIK